MDLMLEELDSLEVPLSNDFWTGVGIGAGIGGVLVGIEVAVLLT